MKKISELTDRDVIHCPTEKEAEAILKLADEAGHPWIIKNNCWCYYKEKTCYIVTEGMYGKLESLRESGYTIHKASEFLEPERKFKVGDKVVPISKSIGEDFTQSDSWKRAKFSQGFVYIIKKNFQTLFSGIADYVISDIPNSLHGDYYMEQDLIPYEEFVLPEKWDIVATEETVDVIAKWFDENWGNKEYPNFYQECRCVQRYRYGLYPGNVLYFRSSSEYPEISFETFKKYVLKQDNMLIELPKSWFVKNDGSQLFKDTVIKYLNANYNCSNWYGNVYSYGVNENGKPDYYAEALLHLWKDAVELTLEQFIQLTTKNDMALKVGDKVVGKQSKLTATNGNEYDIFTKTYVRTIEAIDGDTIVLNGDGKTSLSDYEIRFYTKDFKLAYSIKEMTKEVIGYKCPTDLYGGQVKAGTTFKPTSSKPTSTPVFVAVDANDKVIQSHFELPAEIVETWEPVYKQDEYKIGDWVYWSGNNPTFAKINSEIGTDNCYKLDVDGNISSHNSCHKSNLRKATQEEIKNHLVSLAKEKGFVEKVEFTGVRDTTMDDWGSAIGKPSNSTYSASKAKLSESFTYNPNTDTLTTYGYGVFIVYEKGKWATITPKEKIVSVGGKFNVTIKDGKIWHKSDDITSFVREIKSFVDSIPKKLSGYDFIVDSNNITITKSGCQNHNVTIKDWLDVYKQL